MTSRTNLSCGFRSGCFAITTLIGSPDEADHLAKPWTNCEGFFHSTEPGSMKGAAQSDPVMIRSRLGLRSARSSLSAFEHHDAWIRRRRAEGFPREAGATRYRFVQAKFDDQVVGSIARPSVALIERDTRQKAERAVLYAASGLHESVTHRIKQPDSARFARVRSTMLRAPSGELASWRVHAGSPPFGARPQTINSRLNAEPRWVVKRHRGST